MKGKTIIFIRVYNCVMKKVYFYRTEPI